jgi:hypothetical protein
VLVANPLPARDPLHVIANIKACTSPVCSGVFTGLRPFNTGAVLPSQDLEVFIAMALAGLAGMAIGLFVSSAVRKSDQAVFMLPVILIIEMALSQPILQASNPSPVLKILGDVTSANWAVNAVSATTSLNQIMTSYQIALVTGQDQLKLGLANIQTPAPLLQSQLHAALFGDPAWDHKPGTWILAIFILLVMIALFLGLVLLMMRRLDTGNRRTFARGCAGFCRQCAGSPAPGCGRSRRPAGCRCRRWLRDSGGGPRRIPSRSTGGALPAGAAAAAARSVPPRPTAWSAAARLLRVRRPPAVRPRRNSAGGWRHLSAGTTSHLWQRRRPEAPAEPAKRTRLVVGAGGLNRSAQQLGKLL